MSSFGPKFWGAEVFPDCPYIVSTPAPLRVTVATLGPDVKKGSRCVLMCEIKSGREMPPIPLCTLVAGSHETVNVAMNFDAKTLVHFSVEGPHAVHLAGYLDQSDLEGSDMDADEIDDDQGKLALMKMMGMQGHPDDEDSDDDEEEEGDQDDSEEEGEEEEGEGDEESEDEEEEEEEESSEEEEQPQKGKKRAAPQEEESAKAKKARLADEKRKAELTAANEAREKKQRAAMEAAKAAKAAADKEAAQKEKERQAKRAKEQAEAKAKVLAENKKKAEAKAREEEKAKKAQPATMPLQKTPDGLEFQDVVIGKGAFAKGGRNIVVGYFGKLTNGKKFDSSSNFKFRLGVGEVIKGWDKGFAGMREGGKRRLKIPPHMGYGRQGAPPQIPGNATLLFDVELKRVM